MNYIKVTAYKEGGEFYEVIHDRTARDIRNWRSIKNELEEKYSQLNSFNYALRIESPCGKIINSRLILNINS